MSVVAWILSGLLAALMLMVGLGKLATPHAKLAASPRMGWAGDFSARGVKAIGALEVLAAVGLIVPWLLDIARVLTPLTGVGVAALMVGAMLVHRRRGELAAALPANLVLLLLGVVIAVLRFRQL